MKKCIIFKYSGKFAHFLKAEANASAPSYRIPTRTVLLGLVGAVLGLPKDSPQKLLQNANFSISGYSEATHWHTANLRKDPPATLDFIIKKTAKGTSKDQRNTIITQEWLFKPNFTVFIELPDKFESDFERRIINKEWHYTPSLGLSEMMADLEFIESVELFALPDGDYRVHTAMKKSEVRIDMAKAIEENAMIKSIRMPRDVTENREFSHESYFYETDNNGLYVRTKYAHKAGERVITWL